MGWERVGNAVKARRVGLGMRIQDLANAAQLNQRTVADVERHRREGYSEATISRLEQALRWSPGSVAAILAGGDPTPALDPVPQLPPALARLLAAYARVDARDRDDADRMIGLVAEWVEARAAVRGGGRGAG